MKTRSLVTEALVDLGYTEEEMPFSTEERVKLLAKEALYWRDMARGLTAAALGEETPKGG